MMDATWVHALNETWEEGGEVDFFEVLDHVVDLLRSRGRVTYGALKLQFQLDDAQVEVLKDELIYAQHLAVEEDGRVLVWMEEAHSTPPSPSIRVAPADSIQDVRPYGPQKLDLHAVKGFPRLRPLSFHIDVVETDVTSPPPHGGGF